MLGKLVSRLRGADHLKQRGDRCFLESDFAGALHEYRRARAVLASSDYRAATVDALIRECSLRIGEPVEPAFRPVEPLADGADRPFLPALGDLFELAIADKMPRRAGSYRGLGADFETGYISLVQGDAERAVAHLGRAARTNPSSFVLQLELGRALSLGGHMERAREELVKAVRLSPSDTEGLNLLAAVDIQLGRFEEAAAILDPHVQRKDAGPETTFLMGRSLAGMGRREEAMIRFRETVELDSHFDEAYYEGAKILRETGNLEGAFQLLERACSIVPDEVTYNRDLARLVVENDLDEEVGLAACDRLMVTDEANQWQYLSWIAELYVRRGWRSEARDPLRKALKMVPSDRSGERLSMERLLAEIEN